MRIRTLFPGVLLFAISAFGQATIPFSSARVLDPSAGYTLLNGSVLITVTDQNDNPISYTPQGGSPTTATFSTTILNGAVQPLNGFTFTIVNPATALPNPLYFRIQLFNTGNTMVLDLPVVTIAGASFSLDAYSRPVGSTNLANGYGPPYIACQPSAEYKDNNDTSTIPWVCSRRITSGQIVWTQSPASYPVCSAQAMASAFQVGSSIYCIPSSDAYASPGYILAGPLTGSNPGPVTVQSSTGLPSEDDTARAEAAAAQASANTANSAANAAQTTANNAVIRSGDTMTGTLNMPQAVSKLPRVDVTHPDFGVPSSCPNSADPTGGNDSTCAIQAAILWAQSSARGGNAPPVYFPPGTYKISANITDNGQIRYIADDATLNIANGVSVAIGNTLLSSGNVALAPTMNTPAGIQDRALYNPTRTNSVFGAITGSFESYFWSGTIPGTTQYNSGNVNHYAHSGYFQDSAPGCWGYQGPCPNSEHKWDDLNVFVNGGGGTNIHNLVASFFSAGDHIGHENMITSFGGSVDGGGPEGTKGESLFVGEAGDTWTGAVASGHGGAAQTTLTSSCANDCGSSGYGINGGTPASVGQGMIVTDEQSTIASGQITSVTAPPGGEVPGTMSVNITSGIGNLAVSTCEATLNSALTPTDNPSGSGSQTLTFNVTDVAGACTSGGLLSFEGTNHEQAPITSVTAPSGGQQTITANIRMVHPSGSYIFENANSDAGSFADLVVNDSGTLKFPVEILGVQSISGNTAVLWWRRWYAGNTPANVGGFPYGHMLVGQGAIGALTNTGGTVSFVIYQNFNFAVGWQSLNGASAIYISGASNSAFNGACTNVKVSFPNNANPGTGTCTQAASTGDTATGANVSLTDSTLDNPYGNSRVNFYQGAAIVDPQDEANPIMVNGVNNYPVDGTQFQVEPNEMALNAGDALVEHHSEPQFHNYKGSVSEANPQSYSSDGYYLTFSGIYANGGSITNNVPFHITNGSANSNYQYFGGTMPATPFIVQQGMFTHTLYLTQPPAPFSYVIDSTSCPVSTAGCNDSTYWYGLYAFAGNGGWNQAQYYPATNTMEWSGAQQFLNSLSISGLSGTSPVCPNGTGGALTQTGCVSGSMVWPTGGAGIPNYNGSSGWGSSYSASNQIPANFIPTLNQNTTGTAANLSGTPTLPNGTTAATQVATDNSTKIATDAYVQAAITGSVAGVASVNGQTGAVSVTQGTQNAALSILSGKVNIPTPFQYVDAIKDLGLDNTGASDVSAALCSYINSTMPSSGAAIKFEAGTYKFTSQCTINATSSTKGGLYLVGTIPASSPYGNPVIFSGAIAGADLIEYNNTSAGAGQQRGPCVDNIEFYDTAGVMRSGLHLVQANNTCINHVTFAGFSGNQYSTGTATISSSTPTAVTGSGTAWTSAMAGPNAMFCYNGACQEIASVNSSTSITLVNPWQGAVFGWPSGSSYVDDYYGVGELLDGGDGSSGVNFAQYGDQFGINGLHNRITVGTVGSNNHDYGVSRITLIGGYIDCQNAPDSMATFWGGFTDTMSLIDVKVNQCTRMSLAEDSHEDRWIDDKYENSSGSIPPNTTCPGSPTQSCLRGVELNGSATNEAYGNDIIGMYGNICGQCIQVDTDTVLRTIMDANNLAATGTNTSNHTFLTSGAGKTSATVHDWDMWLDPNGFTGTKTAGSCTLTFVGGLVTAVSGC